MGKGRDKRRRKEKQQQLKEVKALLQGREPPKEEPPNSDPSFVGAPLKPRPDSRSGAIALPEPEEIAEAYSALAN